MKRQKRLDRINALHVVLTRAESSLEIRKHQIPKISHFPELTQRHVRWTLALSRGILRLQCMLRTELLFLSQEQENYRDELYEQNKNDIINLRKYGIN